MGLYTKDDELVFKAKEKDQDSEKELIEIYSEYIKMWIREFHNLSAVDIDQIWFAGFVQFFGCLTSFDKSKGHFYTYCKFCCQREMMNELRKVQRRLKHEFFVDPDEISNYMDLRESNEEEFKYKIKRKEDKEIFLTEIEMKVLTLRAQGDTYKDIANKLNVPKKKIDNSIQAIKRRFKEKE